MAPRETRLEEGGRQPLRADQAARLMESLRSSGVDQYKPPTVLVSTIAKGGGAALAIEPIASMRNVSAATQAAALKAAAVIGVPFCEECEKARKAKAAAPPAQA